jgi:hypothetical protein
LDGGQRGRSKAWIAVRPTEKIERATEAKETKAETEAENKSGNRS